MYCIGVDAGGTKTDAAILDQKNEQLFAIQTGPGNIAVDFHGATKNILSAIQACLASEHGKQCQFIVAGIAGIEKGNAKSQLQTYLEKRLSIPIQLLTDAELAYYAVFGKESGILAIAGTGSVFLGKDKTGTFLTVGGWGHLLGDAGSAYELGINTLKIMIAELDEGKAPSAFSEAITKQYNIDDSATIKEFVYTASKAAIAEIAYHVDQLAIHNDRQAITLINRTATSLVKQTIVLINRLRLPSPVKIACKGSLLEKNERIQQLYAQQLDESGYNVELIFDNTPIVTGARSFRT